MPSVGGLPIFRRSPLLRRLISEQDRLDLQYRVEDIPREVSSKLWSTLIAPRPVVMLTTMGDGCANIAPYSSVSLVANYPPMVAVSFSKRGNAPKQTFANIAATGEFGINLTSRSIATVMNESAASSDQSDDFERLGLTRAEFSTITCGRIVESPTSLACRLVKTVSLEPSSVQLVIATVEEVIVGDEFLNQGLFDPSAADLIAMIGAEDFISLSGEHFNLPRTWG